MSAQGELHSGPSVRHERPFLYPWASYMNPTSRRPLANRLQNRRLRHLHGVSLRNLDTSATPSRNRGKTITDDDAPYNLDSPAKRAFRDQAPSLGHSASFSNLVSANKEVLKTPTKAPTSYQRDGQSNLRPSATRMRRRSTLHWSTASPRARQQKLEDLSVHRLPDVWFSVHLDNLQEPIYISEVMERSMNPSFAFFDIDAASPRIGRADNCILRIWAKDGRHEDYSQLVELTVNLRSLQYIGKHLEDFHHPLPPNCVFLHLSDGIYTSFTDLPGSELAPELHRETSAAPTEFSSSFDALMQLANLEDCVQDALKVREQLEHDADSVLSQMQPRLMHEQLFNSKRESLAATKSASSSVSRQKFQLQKRRDELKESIRLRRDAVRADAKHQPSESPVQGLRRATKDIREQTAKISEEAQGQMRRIGEELMMIFPIEAIRNKALHFSIRRLYLPNSAFDDTNRDEIAAALTFTAQLVHQLSLYMSMPLPYPIDATASNPTIEDPISMGIAQRKYPLQPTSVTYKFEYGVFLLNKDIEFLMCKAGLRVLDIRHTLPNLKYLLYVLTAGSGELPARKAGGVRGLLGGRLTPNISRRGSEESVAGSREYMKRSNMHSRRSGSVVSVQEPHEKGEGEDVFGTSPAATTLPRRQKISLHAGH
jgi:UV radiation resistance-associated gene protein